MHLHVFPRYKGDSFRIQADRMVRAARTELDQVARQIGQAYGRLWGTGQDLGSVTR